MKHCNWDFKLIFLVSVLKGKWITYLLSHFCMLNSKFSKVCNELSLSVEIICCILLDSLTVILICKEFHFVKIF